jgi:type VI secretion system secreted protein VgrG
LKFHNSSFRVNTPSRISILKNPRWISPPSFPYLTAELSISPEHAYPIEDHEIYDYPGEYSEVGDGDLYVRKKLEELQAQHERVELSGNARGMGSGYLFTLDNYPRAEANKISHSIQSDNLETSGGEGEFYACRLVAADSLQQYRSERRTPKPVVQGPQTAMVVGPPKEEIHCDKYGRVIVQFHWDRYGKHNQNSSCWVRVSQAWALEGDPDQPLITGRVYNADNLPPYELPDNKTQSGIKSRSTKDGTAKDFNEIRFEDEKDKEEIYVHAEKDLTTVVENNEKRKTYNTRKATVGSKKKERPTETIEELVVHGSREISITGDDDLTIKEGKKGRKLLIEDACYEMEVQKKNYTIRVPMGHALITAGSIELQAGGSSITLDNSGVKIKGLKVDITGDTQTSVKGTIVDIKGAAVTNITGGIVKIN